MQRLVLVIHNHQPVGNFDHVFKDAYDRCYRPFLDICAEYPHVKLGLHYTGPLLEWIEANAPAFLKDLKALVVRGQVEILGGGFYEPMLAVLPDSDVRGQIAKMRAFTASHFGTENTGMWLAERVWDPDLPRALHGTGIQYTLLDDAHFFAAGLSRDGLSGHYVTEKSGHTLSVFPIDQQLRYAIPWKPIPELEQQFRELEQKRGDDPRCLTYGDDGEKFGLWPGTWDWIFGTGGLKDCFRFLSARGDLGATRLPREALAETPPTGRIYLPTASYEEMGEWSLPAAAIHSYEALKHRLQHEHVYERFQPFVRGGIWQGFFAKYPESNYLHKRVLQVGDRLRTSEAWSAPRRKLLDEAFADLYRSECNCAYWHGLFGGLYLNNLRHGVWSALLRAERAFDVVERGPGPFLTASTADLDADLVPEVMVRGEGLSAVVSPALGGSLLEIADLTRAFQLMNVLTRREEGYHDKLRALDERAAREGQGGQGGSAPTNAHDLSVSKEQNLSRFHPCAARRPPRSPHRFFPVRSPRAAPTRAEDGDLGTFADRPYKLAAPIEVADGAAIEIALSADGSVAVHGGQQPLRLQKRYAFKRGRAGFDVRYRIENPGAQPVKALFAPELNLSLLTGDAEDRVLELGQARGADRNERMAFRGEVPHLSRFAISDGWANLRLRVETQRPFELWAYPVETVSQSEGGFERTYQGSCFLLRTPVELAPGAAVELAFRLDLQHPEA